MFVSTYLPKKTKPCQKPAFLPAFCICLLLCSPAVLLASCNTTRHDNIQTQKLAESGELDKALAHATRTLDKVRTERGEASLLTAKAYDKLAQVEQGMGLFDKAESHFKQALKIRENNPDAKLSDIAVSLNVLGTLYKHNGQPSKAAPLLERSVDIIKKERGKHDPETALASVNLADLYIAQNRYSKARTLLEDAINTLERPRNRFKYARESGIAMAALASVYEAQGKLDKARASLEEALRTQQDELGANSPDVALTYNRLAQLQAKLGKNDIAIGNFRKSLELLEMHLGHDHPHVALALRNYGEILARRGQIDTAADLIKRAAAIQQKSLSANHPDLAATLMTRARIEYYAKWYDKAATSARQALKIRLAAYGPNNGLVAQTYTTLGEIYRAAGQNQQAENELEKARAIATHTFGPTHPQTSAIYANLAALMVDTGRFNKAKALYTQAVNTVSSVLGADNPTIAALYHGLSKLENKRGNMPLALGYAKKARTAYVNSTLKAAQSGESAALDMKLGRNLFETGLKLYASASPEKHAGDAFEIFQLAQITGTSQALSRMAARFAAGSDALATLVRKQEQITTQVKDLTEQLLQQAASSKSDETGKIKQTDLRQQITSLKRENETLATRIERKFPRYAEMINPKPFNLSHLQKLLEPGEALITYFVGESDVFVLAASPTKASFVPLDITSANLTSTVRKLRLGLDPVNIGPDGIPPYDVQTAHLLYNQIIAPVDNIVSTTKNLIVVPDSALESLPFSVLVSKPATITAEADYRKVGWLSDRMAFSVVPSVSSLRALREFAKVSRASKTFAGFGNPVLDGQGTQTGTLSDIFLMMEPLPESAHELLTIAKTLGTGSQSLYLAAQATEAAVRGADLSQYRVLSFATHGLMAGEFMGLSEPALVLTPPEKFGDPANDGLLLASEISELELDAQWVVLSACNTAAPSGEPGAEGLSGLAKAFFYAGSRSMLVSNWQVETNASVRISTGLFKRLKDNPAMTRAEALRQSMKDLQNDAQTEFYAHPMFWAPFMVVGEGSAMSHEL